MTTSDLNLDRLNYAAAAESCTSCQQFKDGKYAEEKYNQSFNLLWPFSFIFFNLIVHDSFGKVVDFVEDPTEVLIRIALSITLAVLGTISLGCFVKQDVIGRSELYIIDKDYQVHRHVGHRSERCDGAIIWLLVGAGLFRRSEVGGLHKRWWKATGVDRLQRVRISVEAAQLRNQELVLNPSHAIRFMAVHHQVLDAHSDYMSLKSAVDKQIAAAMRDRDAAVLAEQGMARQILTLHALTDKNRLIGVYGKGPAGMAVHTLLMVAIRHYVRPTTLDAVQDDALQEAGRYVKMIEQVKAIQPPDPTVSST